MNWLNLYLPTIQSPDFLGAEHQERSVWLSLMVYCCTQENGGRLLGVRTWTDRKILQVLRLDREELLHPTVLWAWDGDDLVVHHYPSEKEDQVRHKRESGRCGGKVSKRKKDAPLSTDSPDSQSDSKTPKAPDKQKVKSAISTPISTSPSTQSPSGLTEGEEEREREGEKELEREVPLPAQQHSAPTAPAVSVPTPPAGASPRPQGQQQQRHEAVSSFPTESIPSLEEVHRYARSAPVPIGQPCAIAFHDTFSASGWLTKYGQPIRDWRAALRRYATVWNQNDQSSGKPRPYGTSPPPGQATTRSPVADHSSGKRRGFANSYGESIIID